MTPAHLVSASVHLSSLDPGGADIPIASGGVCFLSQVGLLVALLTVGHTDRRAPLSRP